MLGLSYSRPIAVQRGRTTVVRTTFQRKCIVPMVPRHGKGRMTIVNTNPTKLTTTGRLGQGKCAIALFSGTRTPKKLLHFNVPGFGLGGGVVSHHVRLLGTRNVHFRVGAAVSPARLPRKFSTCYVYAKTRAPQSLLVPKHRLGNVRFTLRVLSRRGQVIRKRAFSGSGLMDTGKGGMLIVNNNSAKSSYVKADVHRKTVDMARVRVVPRPPIKRGSTAP